MLIINKIATSITMAIYGFLAIGLVGLCIIALDAKIGDSAPGGETRTPTFSFEQTALAPGYLKTQTAVAFVIRNNSNRTAKMVQISCAVYDGQRLIDVGEAIMQNLEPGISTPGRTLPIDRIPGLTPDRAECAAQVIAQ
jgi:hypothetical protein